MIMQLMEKGFSSAKQHARTFPLRLNLLIMAIFLVKLIAAGFFSSGYLKDLFIPFVTSFITHHVDPWQYFYTLHPNVTFPYPPLMLYILTPGAALLHFADISSIFLSNMLIKAPIFIADLAILAMLCRYRPQDKLLFVLIYYASPIIFYAAYLQGQLDLIPIAFLLASVFLLFRSRVFYSLLMFTAALLCKSTAVVALPFLIIFLYRRFRLQTALSYLISTFVLYLLVSLPYVLHQGYIQIVLHNPQQNFIFNSGFAIGNLQIFPVIFISLVSIAHFMLYKKINNDLLLNYLGLAFSVFLVFAYPIPSWFVWVIPFLSFFLVVPRKERRAMLFLYAMFNAVYIVFFLFFYHYPLDPGMSDLLFLNQSVQLYRESDHLNDIVFTLLTGMLAIQVYLNYRYSILSNAIYKNRSHATLIGISGDSAAGKSILSGDLCELLGLKNVSHLEGDGEHRWERGNENWKKYTHLDPKANLLHQQADVLEKLKQGLCIYHRAYNHKTGKFTDAKLVQTNNYVLIAGLHTFYLPKSRKLVDIKIFVDTDESLRRHWKINRDRENRNYTREEVLKSLEKRATDREKYIVPQKKFADLCFRYFTDEPFNEGEALDPHIKLGVTLSANVNLEKAYTLFAECKNLTFHYDYSEDMNMQEMTFAGDITASDVKKIANHSIENLEELISSHSIWQDSLRGLRQLMTLLVVSHFLKEA